MVCHRFTSVFSGLLMCVVVVAAPVFAQDAATAEDAATEVTADDPAEVSTQDESAAEDEAETGKPETTSAASGDTANPSAGEPSVTPADKEVPANPDEVGKTENAEAADAGKTEPAGPDENATLAAAETSSDNQPAAQAFEKVLQRWKSLLKEIRDIRAEYLIADTDKLPELQEQWKAKIAAGREMEGELHDAAINAYRELPNEDRELVRFLMTIISDRIRDDDYRSAKELTDILIAGNCDEKEINDLAGIAAFGTNDFEAAETYLEQAEAAGTISNQGQQFLNGIADVKANWEQEAALREQEADQDLPRVKLQTDAGDIVVELFENEAPETVGNFISLVEKGFYEQNAFHRVLQGFMAQGGCPNKDGSGGPGYNIYCECVNDNHRKHFAGSLSMAKQQARNTGGSQFFFTFVPTPFLDGKHTVFGRVVEGWETLPKIVKRDPSGALSAA